MTFQDAAGKTITEAAAGTVVTVVAAGTGRYVPKTYTTDDSATTVAADEDGKQVFTMPAKNIKVTVEFEEKNSDELFAAARAKLTNDVLNYTVKQADINNEAAAKTDVETKLATALTGTGVTAVVTTTGTFKAATGSAEADATAENNGSYTYSVALKVGDEAEQNGAAINGTVTIEATSRLYKRSDLSIGDARALMVEYGAGATAADVFAGKTVVPADTMKKLTDAIAAAMLVDNQKLNDGEDSTKWTQENSDTIKAAIAALNEAKAEFTTAVENLTEKGTKTDAGLQVLTGDAGISANPYFTVTPADLSLTLSSAGVFADGYAAGDKGVDGERIPMTNDSKIEFTVAEGKTADLRVYWVCNDNGTGKGITLTPADKGTAGGQSTNVVKNTSAIATWSGLAAGKYTITGKQYIFRVEVAEKTPVEFKHTEHTVYVDGDENVTGGSTNENAQYPLKWQLAAEAIGGAAVTYSKPNADASAEFIELTESGLVTAKKVGTTTVTATATIDGTAYTAECAIHVLPRITKVEVNAPASAVKVGDKVTMTATVTASAGATDAQKAVKWAVDEDDADLAEINETTGELTAKKAGSVTITATRKAANKHEADVTGTYELTVDKAVPVLTLTCGNEEVTSGAKVRFKLEGVPEGVTPTFTVKQGETVCSDLTVYALSGDTDGYNYQIKAVPRNTGDDDVVYTVTADVAASGDYAAATSAPATFKVLPAGTPNINITSGQTKTVNATVGQSNVKLAVEAEVRVDNVVQPGVALSYSWKKGSTALTETGKELTLPAADLATAGRYTYTCTVTGAAVNGKTPAAKTVTFTVVVSDSTAPALTALTAALSEASKANANVVYDEANKLLTITGKQTVVFNVTATPTGHNDTLKTEVETVSGNHLVSAVYAVGADTLTITPLRASDPNLGTDGKATPRYVKLFGANSNVSWQIKVLVKKLPAPEVLKEADVTVTAPTTANGKGKIKINNPKAGVTYRYKTESATTWTDMDSTNEAEVAPGKYMVRIKVADNGAFQEISQSLLVTVPAYGATADTYTITCANAVGGSVSANKTSAKKGDTVTLTVKANDGYELDTLTVTGMDNSSVTVTDNKFTMPGQNVTVKATFKKIGGGDPDQPADKTALNAAIAAAEALAADTYTVADDTTVSQVKRGTKFVTDSDQAALAAAIAAAKAVANDAAATEADVAAAQKALADAVSAFNAAIRTGTKSSLSSAPAGGAAGGSTTTNVTNPAGGTTTVKKDAVGNVTITATDKNGEVLASVKIPATIPSVGYKFVDVPAGHWAENAINDMAGLQLVKGVDEAKHLFDMTSPITRGAVATILSRLANGKAAVGDTFSDVTEGQWFAEGVAWAAKAGVVTGFEDGTFGPEGSITREQLAVMIARYAKLLGIDTTAAAGELAEFTDAESIQSWAIEGMAWCVKVGIIQGRGNGIVDPGANATRAEAAVMLGRLVELLK